jgi:hypothetical protein
MSSSSGSNSGSSSADMNILADTYQEQSVVSGCAPSMCAASVCTQTQAC